MKKIFLLCITLIGAASSFAQTDIDPAGVFVFTDKDGNVYDDGAIIECTEGEYNDYDTWQFPSGLYVKRTSDAASFAVGMTADVKRIDNGILNVCFPQMCLELRNIGVRDLGIESLEGTSSYNEDTEMAGLVTEWIPTSETAYGECSATFTLTTSIKNGFLDYTTLGESRKITVNFIQKDPTAINGVQDGTKATVTARYTTDGQQISSPVKGINILKLSDGRAVKVNIK